MDEHPLRITRPNGMNPWRAGCVETRTSGSEGGPRKRTGGNAGTAPRSDPYTHFTRAGCCAYAIIDMVSRKWIATLVSVEETSTQTEVVFTRALEQEGLLELIEARHDGRVDLATDDESRPILLAMSIPR